MSTFDISRSVVAVADPAHLHPLVDDFHQWVHWSPWEEIDPGMRREFSGAERGVGARYAWSGNRKAGSGSMEIIDSGPREVRIRLTFLKPWKATNEVVFSFVPVVEGTEVTWLMSGEQKGLTGLFGRFVSMDKLVGKDFERGLTRLKELAEAPMR